MNLKKILYLITICLLINLFIVSCKNFQEDSGKIKFPMAIGEVKEYYGTGFISYTTINENEVFVKYKSEFGSGYNVINFKEKKIYEIPTIIETLNFKDSINDNELIFEAFGGNHMNSYERFPFLINANKTEEEYKLEEDIFWNEIGREIKTNTGNEGEMKNILINSEGLQITFHPYEGKEADFYAAYVDTPPTTVEFADNGNMTIEFRDSRISKNIDLKYLENIEHKYISEIHLKEGENSLTIFITLDNVTEEYSLSKNKLDEEIPFIEIKFR